MLETWVFYDLLLTFKVRGKTSEAQFSLLSGKKWACYCHPSTHYVVRPVWTVTKKRFFKFKSQVQKQSPRGVNMFIRIFPNSQKNTCARVSFSALLKKRLWYRCFPVNFAKFCETPLVTASVGKYKMPSKEILRIRNCIHITAILYFHLDLMSKCVSLKILELKLDCKLHYLALI